MELNKPEDINEKNRLILEEVNKAIGLLNDGTYDKPELFHSHILQIIRDNSVAGEKHKDQLERFLYKWNELREQQRLFWAGHKNKLNLCKQLENEFDKKVGYLLSTGGYSIERFNQPKPKQGELL